MEITFEFGETAQSRAFFQRNQQFLPAFERLVILINKCFVRSSLTPSTLAANICFSLGETCRQDFLEILFLAVNGYGTAAYKLLRGLYERAVTMAYIMKHPEKAERFHKFSAIHDAKSAEAALVLVSEEDFDNAIAPFTIRQIRELREHVKPEFLITQCHKCGRKGLAFTWDTDLASMAKDVGAPYLLYYMPAYIHPSLHIHATFASLSESSLGDRRRDEKNRADFDGAVMIAARLFLDVMRSQDEFFSLNLKIDAEAIEADTNDLWERLHH